MTSMAAKFISKKLLGESLANNFGKEDPYFETVPATRLDGRPSSKKAKKRRKANPPGISDHDGKILTKVKRRAYRLDMSLFNCCGIRFGWSSVLGIVPGAGDVVDAFMALMVYRTCTQVEGGLPANVKSKMMFNIVLDFCIGLVPFLGDLADAVFKANTRNAAELEDHLRRKGLANLKAAGQPPPAEDPSHPAIFDGQVTPPEQIEDNRTRKTQRVPGQSDGVIETRPAQSGGGWLKKNKQSDPERGGQTTLQKDRR